MSNTVKINVNAVQAALELIRSFRNVPLETIEWVDNTGMIYGHPKEEAAQDAGQGWFPLDDWKFCGLNNTSYFEQFIEPYIQVPEPSVNYARATPTELGGHPFPSPTPFQQINLDNDPSIPLSNFAMSSDGAVVHDCVDLSYGGMHGLTIKSHGESSLNVSYNRFGHTENDLYIDIDRLVALADLRECVGRQMTRCPACDTEQVQLLDNLTNPLNPSWRCRSCKHRFHTTLIIPFNLLIRAKYGDLLKGQPVAAYLAENDPVAIPVHICNKLCCMNDGNNSLLPAYSVRLLTEDERIAYSKAKSFNISTTELFDAMADEEPKL